MSGETPILPDGKPPVDTGDVRKLVAIEAARECIRELGGTTDDGRIERFAERIPVLLEWVTDHGREFPWRTTSDEWSIYIGEILLQRTRAENAAPVHTELMETYPTPADLRAAPEGDLRKLVEPLGFGNRRVRILREAAKLCLDADDVPDSIERLKEPWGVGDYTARATLVFAKDVPRGLVDTNFARIFSRVFALDLSEAPHKNDVVYALADSLVPDGPTIARAYNLALLDLGADICTPADPDCGRCPLSGACAYAERLG